MHWALNFGYRPLFIHFHIVFYVERNMCHWRVGNNFYIWSKHWILYCRGFFVSAVQYRKQKVPIRKLYYVLITVSCFHCLPSHTIRWDMIAFCRRCKQFLWFLHCQIILPPLLCHDHCCHFRILYRIQWVHRQYHCCCKPPFPPFHIVFYVYEGTSGYWRVGHKFCILSEQ